MPPLGVAGTQAEDTPRTTERTGVSSSICVSPSRQEFGTLNSSVWTSSTPALRNASTAHVTARCMPGVPGMRPPISSHNTRRFPSSCGELEISLSRRSAGAGAL
jgi:hypothetical protein